MMARIEMLRVENEQLRENLKTVWGIIYKNIRISDFDGMSDAYVEYKKLLHVPQQPKDLT